MIARKMVDIEDDTLDLQANIDNRIVDLERERGETDRKSQRETIFSNNYTITIVKHDTRKTRKTKQPPADPTMAKKEYCNII